MPRFSFRYAEKESIQWRFDRHPSYGEEVTLGDRGVYRVLEGPVAKPLDPTVDAEYLVERVRDATYEDIKAQLDRGVDKLP